jgi:hypothetical protein
MIFNRVLPKHSDRYPYDYRVSVRIDQWDDIRDWLKENKIPHTAIPDDVFYMKEEHISWLALRWGGD